MGLLATASMLLASPLAIAATTSGSGSTSGSNSGTTTTTTTANKEESAEDPEKAIEKLVEAEKAKQPQADRLKARIARLNIKLTAAEASKLKTKCVAAQGIVKTQEIKVNSGITARSKAYDELLDHLDKLITKLKSANVATTDLEAERTALKTKIDTFKKDLTTYKVALSDVQAQGCLADPTAFKAALEDARTARKTVADDAAGIRSYVNDTVKPTLKTLKASIDKTTTTDTTKATGGAQ